MYKNTQTKGFTLIELLVVIAIISLLSSIVMASLSGARNKAKLAKAFATMKSMNTSAYMCLENGNSLNIPESSAVGGGLLCSGGNSQIPNISDTGFIYCGNGCGGWTSDNLNKTYAFSMYSDAYPDGRKIIVCGSKFNVTGWFFTSSPFDFTKEVSCVKTGF